jgi:WD40 repeat protein
VAFSPDGQTLASGSEDQTVRLWDVKTGQVRASLQGHTDGVNAVAYSPDGQTLASGSADRTVRLWDVNTGQVRASLQGHTDGVNAVALSPDGLTIASGSYDQTVRLWDVNTGQVRASLQGHTGGVMSVAFSPDGQTLASGSADRTVRLWDGKTGQTRATLPRHTGWVRAVAFSPDSKRVFGWAVNDKLLAWTVSDGQPTDPVNPPWRSPGPAVVTSPDGSLRAEARSYGIVLIDTEADRRDRAERLALEPVNRVWWHQQQAEQAEQDKNWFAAEFHLRQLLKDKPDDADLKRRHDQAAAKLKRPPPMQPLPRP